MHSHLPSTLVLLALCVTACGGEPAPLDTIPYKQTQAIIDGSASTALTTPQQLPY